jgi:hypothetical protein
MLLKDYEIENSLLCAYDAMYVLCILHDVTSIGL